MKKIILAIFVFVLIASFSSCVKEIQVEVPDNNSKLVVSSHLSAGNDLLINVSASTPLYEESDGEMKKVENATVRISNDKINWHVLIYNSSLQAFSLPSSIFPLSEGGSYHLEVSDPGYETVTSETTVPVYKPLQVSLANIDTTSNEYGDDYLNARFRFSDLTGQPNYYGVIAYAYSGSNATQLNYESSMPWVFSDAQADGKEYILDFNGSFMLGNCDSVQLRVYQTNEAFYRFHYSMAMFTGDSNPFSEASPVYTNITNGLGVFSGFAYRDYYFPVNLAKRK